MSPRARGFTLLEMSITLLIIAFLVSAGAFASNEVANTKRARAQMDAIALYNGQVGTRDVNGFYGDVGRLSPPVDAATEMVVSMPAGLARQVMVRGVTVGWRGPYAGYNVTSLGLDPWSAPWSIDTQGRISSRGPDGVAGTSDDVFAPLAGQGTVIPGLPVPGGDGIISVVVIDPLTRQYLDAATATVVVSRPNSDNSGNLFWEPAVATAPPGYDFRAANLRAGRHAIVVTGLGAFAGAQAYGAAYVTGGTAAAVTLRLHF